MAEDGSAGAAKSTDWVARATGAIESLVALVRDHSLRPLLVVLRFTLLGLLCLLVGALVLVLGVIGIVRLLTADAYSGAVWASDLTVGAPVALLGAGLIVLSRRLGRERPNA